MFAAWAMVRRVGHRTRDGRAVVLPRRDRHHTEAVQPGNQPRGSLMPAVPVGTIRATVLEDSPCLLHGLSAYGCRAAGSVHACLGSTAVKGCEK